MGYKSLQIKLPTDYSEDDIRHAIRKKLGLKEFSYLIEKKSLDARKKDFIHWLVNVTVSSSHFKGPAYLPPDRLEIPYSRRDKRVIVVGSGPAGFFSAYVLQKSGFDVTIIERGSEVGRRSAAIEMLEGSGIFSSENNYAFGEGGAGTFSDGKLTSRSKHISAERQFFLTEYVKAGAPEEILYMAHPHVGTDNLKIVVARLRETFREAGGTILFDTMLEDIVLKGNRVRTVITSAGEFHSDFVVLATGHSAYDTYRMLIRHGIGFRTKNFAIGHRIEHEQSLINRAQWGRDSIPGVKAAEYRLATKTSKDMGVYSFCMCPGGYVVPSAAFGQRSVVNGMSYYSRDGRYANAGIVVGVHPDLLAGGKCTPLAALDWMDRLEEKFYAFADGLVIPASTVRDYLRRKPDDTPLKGSYTRGMVPTALYDMVPSTVSEAIVEGIADFSKKLKGFELGTLMGLESKTSSPIQVARESDGRCTGFENLFFAGEGSGYAGGIVSSAADGIRCALAIASI
ncbi:MAG TPA: NAD(P)/FAD-dependent oxidoreductase [Bacteroidales bacterium]|nr:NAD(P)/FAD-dependent oxidoreductase [Bacteroidales bacterium]